MKRTLQTILFALVAMMVPIGAWAQTSTIDLSTLTGTYVISDSEEYIFTGSGSYGIKVEKGNPRIVLNNASITVGEGSAIDVASGSNTTIFVLGDNTIGTTKTESWNEPCGGIFVAEGGTVNITSNGTDNILRARGTLAAAIGGKYVYAEESYNAGNISISNVAVYAYANNYYAAAIGAAGEGTCGTINITNAVVYAYGAGDRWTSAPGIGSAWSLTGWPETIPVVIISDSELHTFRYHSASDYIGYLGDVDGNVDGSTFATGSINCGDGGSVKNSTIYCYTGLDAITTDKVVKYGALGGLLKEDGTCEGEHSFTGNICDNCGYCPCTHEGSEHTYTDNGDGTHSFTCSICGEEVTEVHSSEKNEHKTTCQHGNICDLCGTEYGEPDPNAHTYNEEGKCSACGAYKNFIDLSTLTETYIINDNKYHLFTGSGSYGIMVEKGNPRIVLNNANITLADGDYYENNPINGIHIASTVGTTIIYVMGNNSITAEAGAGIFAAEGSTVKIIGNSREDVLTTSGAEGGSGIGGYVFINNNNDLVCCNSGNIEITNVTVKAFGSQSGLGDAAPAIGAAGNANCGYVTIDNAEVYAEGFISPHSGSSAIGTGADFITCQGGTIGEISIINNSNVYVTRGNYCDYIGISGHEIIPAEGIVNATAKSSAIYCYDVSSASEPVKTLKYGALGGLLKEDGTCEGEHTYANGVCENCGYKCTHEGSEHTCTDNGDGTHSFTCSICGEEVTEVHSYTLTAESNMLTEVCACGHPNGTITIEAADKTYDGKAVEVVITKMGSLENADIPIAYTKDGEAFTGDPIEAGSYTATITMEEKSASVEFTIVQANVEAAEIALEYDETVYDGTEKTPAVTAVVVDGVAIDPASYDVTYADNTAIGTATVTITFKGNYTGTVSTTFEILEDTTDVDMTTVGGGQATVIYDLTGRRVTKMEKGGIYIVDGKKVFLRK